MISYIQIHERDSVAIVYEDAPAGTVLDIQGNQLTLLEPIMAGHKVAIRSLAVGEHVYKFGYSIGVTTREIAAGEWIHTHNVRSGLGGVLEYTYQPLERSKGGEVELEVGAGAESEAEDHNLSGLRTNRELTFDGYVRSDGSVGIRNEIWIINTVGCINKTCDWLASKGNQQFKDRGIDGVYHFAHPYGCSQLGDDLKLTQQLLASLIQHPNAAGVLVVGLGCENNQINSLRNVLGDYDRQRVKFMSSQEVADELEQGMLLIQELVDYAESMTRQPVPISELKIGLKCGGSDGFSGITANPLVGAVSDLLISYGATTILTEVPEMFGAETILLERAADEATFNQTVSLVNDFKQYFIRHGQEVYENPSPGNKAGGITTLEEKSLGCIQKGGTSAVVDVLPYGHRVHKHGLNLIQAPGNDQVSVTALAAAGAHLVLFTTGRGTPFGGPVPTVKISSNSSLAERKKHWIDFNAGRLIEGEPMAKVNHQLFQDLLSYASGHKQTNNEKFDFREIAIFKDGVTL